VPGLCSFSEYLPCALFYAHFVSLVFRSVTVLTLSGRLSRFGCKIVSLLSSSQTAPCVRDVRAFFACNKACWICACSEGQICPKSLCLRIFLRMWPFQTADVCWQPYLVSRDVVQIFIFSPSVEYSRWRQKNISSHRRHRCWKVWPDFSPVVCSLGLRLAFWYKLL
jgi:hypothetical protein